MPWAYCTNGWCKDVKEVTGSQIRWRGNKKGRPTLRWMDDVKLDLKNKGVKRRRTRALDRTEWASVMREAKVKLQGP
jgi:hypothetical protein